MSILNNNMIRRRFDQNSKLSAGHKKMSGLMTDNSTNHSKIVGSQQLVPALFQLAIFHFSFEELEKVFLCLIFCLFAFVDT